MKLVIFIASIFAFISLSGVATAANRSDFVIDSYAAIYHLGRDTHKVSTLAAEEAYVVKFPETAAKMTGLVRSIPLNYLGNSVDLKITSVTEVTGQRVPYHTETKNGSLNIIIGDPSITVAGEQNYLIKYNAKGVINFLGNLDEFNPNLNGRGWNEPFNNMSAAIYLPKELASELISYRCLIDSGSCKINKQTQANETQITLKANNQLPAKQALTVKLDFKPGTFKPYKAPGPLKNVLLIGGLVLGFLILLASVRTAWSHIWGKQKR